MNLAPILDEIYSYRLIYANSFEVTERILQLETGIIESKDKLKIFSAISPGQIIPKDNINDPVKWLSDEIDKILNTLEDNIIEKYRLELYLSYLEANSNEDE